MNWKERLINTLEPVFGLPDPRTRLGAYHDMPYAIFHYPPEAEFELRSELKLLVTRLENAGKRVTVISLAECLGESLEKQSISPEDVLEAERSSGLQAMIDTIHNVLADSEPTLVDLVTRRLPENQDASRDVVLIYRAGALFPVYRTHALLEQLKGRLNVPAALFYPGELEGPTGLRFMGVLDTDPNYRPRIF